jgi:hypothetical protein
MSLSATGPFREGPVATGRAFPYRSNMGMMNSAEFVVFHDDFINAIATNVPAGWSAAVIDTGATLTASATAGSLGATGGALIASDGTSEGVAIYLPKAIQLTAGKKFFMEARVQTSIAAETDVQIGLSDLTATTNPEDLWTTTAANLVAFGTLAGAASTKMLADKSNSGTAAQTGTRSLSNTTWHRIAIGYDGDKLRGYVDGKESLTWSSANSTIPTGVALAPFIGARTGATAGNVTTFDYVRFVLER